MEIPITMKRNNRDTRVACLRTIALVRLAVARRRAALRHAEPTAHVKSNTGSGCPGLLTGSCITYCLLSKDTIK